MDFKRLSESKAWVKLPKTQIKNIKNVFQERFESFLQHRGKGELFAEGRIYKSEICMRIGHLPKSSIASICFEASINYESQSSASEKILLLVDCIEMLAQSYFSKTINNHKPDDSLPREWKEETFKKQKVFLRFTTINPFLEEKANRLLGETEEKLVQGNASEEELEKILQSLNLKKHN